MAVSRRIRPLHGTSRSAVERTELDRLAAGARAAAASTRQRGAALAVEQLVVVEVDVHDRRQRAARASARPSAERVRRRQLEHAPAVVEADPGRLVERGARRARRQVRRPPGGRGAVGVPEVGDGRHHFGVGVPAAAAEEARLEPLVAQPARPRAAPLRPDRRPSGARGSATSSGCGARTVRAPPPRGRARRRARASSPAAGGRISEAIAKPPGRAVAAARDTAARPGRRGAFRRGTTRPRSLAYRACAGSADSSAGTRPTRGWSRA